MPDAPVAQADRRPRHNRFPDIESVADAPNAAAHHDETGFRRPQILRRNWLPKRLNSDSHLVFSSLAANAQQRHSQGLTSGHVRHGIHAKRVYRAPLTVL